MKIEQGIENSKINKGLSTDELLEIESDEKKLRSMDTSEF